MKDETLVVFAVIIVMALVVWAAVGITTDVNHQNLCQNLGYDSGLILDGEPVCYNYVPLESILGETHD